MTNPFDTLAGYEPQMMDGLFSKLKKSVKKVARKVDSAARKITKKVTPKFVDNARKKVKKEVLSSPIGTAAVMVASSVLMGPAVAAIAGKMGVVSSAAIKGATLVGKKAMTDAVKKGYVKTATAKAKAQVQKQASQIAQVNSQIAKDPDFQKVVVQMKGAGKTDAQIIQAWSQSKTAKTLAQSQAAKIMLPQITAQLRADKSVPSKDVPALAAQLSNQMAADAVKAAQAKAVAPVVKSPNQAPVVVNTQAPSPLPVLPLLAIATSLLV